MLAGPPTRTWKKDSGVGPTCVAVSDTVTVEVFGTATTVSVRFAPIPWNVMVNPLPLSMGEIGGAARPDGAKNVTGPLIDPASKEPVGSSSIGWQMFWSNAPITGAALKPPASIPGR